MLFLTNWSWNSSSLKAVVWVCNMDFQLAVLVEWLDTFQDFRWSPWPMFDISWSYSSLCLNWWHGSHVNRLNVAQNFYINFVYEFWDHVVGWNLPDIEVTFLHRWLDSIGDVCSTYSWWLFRLRSHPKNHWFGYRTPFPTSHGILLLLLHLNNFKILNSI